MASLPAKGYEVILGAGLEVTPGTPVSATEWYEIQNENIIVAPEYLDLTGLTGTRGTSRTSRRIGNIPVGGDLMVYARHNIIGNWLYWAMGGGSGAAPSLDSNPLPTITLEVDKKIRKIIANGCKIGTLELSSATNEALAIHPTLVGMGYSSGVGGVTTPSYDDQVTYPILMHWGLTLNVGGSAIELNKFNLTINNNLDEGHFVNSHYRTVVPEGRREINLSLGLDWDTQTMVTRGVWAAFLAGTTASLVASYSDGTHTLTLTMPYVSYTGLPVNVGSPSAIYIDATAVADDSGPGVNDALVVSGL